MKKHFLLIVFLMSGMWFTSCKKEDSVQPITIQQDTIYTVVTPPDTNADNGTAIFYVKKIENGIWNYGFRLWINGKYFDQTGSVPNFEPYCGSLWGLNYWNHEGTYHFHIETFNGYNSYDSTFTIYKQDCTQIALSNQQ